MLLSIQRRSGLHRSLLATVALTALVVAPSALAQEATDDATLRSRVVLQLQDEQLMRGNDIAVSIDGDTVVLAGDVPSVWARDEAERIASEVAGVDAVDNRLAVTMAASDEGIGIELRQRINDYVLYGIFDLVTARVENGEVTLAGKVTNGVKRSEIGQIAARVPGVREVHNEIELLDTSLFDSQLRQTLAARIYRSSDFYDRAFEMNPPIHILVEDGHVTLAGYVRSGVQKQKAGIIARHTPGALSVENELVVESAG